MYCRSPHVSTCMLICVLEHYKLCPTTSNNDLPGNKNLISEKDYIMYFPLTQDLENVV